MTGIIWPISSRQRFRRCLSQSWRRIQWGDLDSLALPLVSHASAKSTYGFIPPFQQSWKWREVPRRAPTARLPHRCQYYVLEAMTICPDRSRPNHDNLSDMWCKKSLLWRTKTARKETRWPAFFRFQKAWKIFLTCDFSTILKYYAMDIGSHHRMTSTGLAS